MGIGWLWFYTHSHDADTFNRENERRAFVIYSRWRAITLWTGNIYTRICASNGERLARQSLSELSDHLLEDIGMFRTGSGVRVEELHRIEFSTPALSCEEKEATDDDTVAAVNSN